MCNLVFFIGGEKTPFVLCSTRDENMARPTERGRIVDDVYTPLDLESSGTWIGFAYFAII